jgi:hypothetical protein
MPQRRDSPSSVGHSRTVLRRWPEPVTSQYRRRGVNGALRRVQNAMVVCNRPLLAVTGQERQKSMFGKRRPGGRKAQQTGTVVLPTDTLATGSSGAPAVYLREVGTSPQDKALMAQLLSQPAEWANTAPGIALTNGVVRTGPTQAELVLAVAAPARPRLTIASVVAIFQRHGWRYQLLDNERLGTSFDGVRMIIGVEPRHEIVTLLAPVFLAQPSNRRASQLHARDVDTFLSAVNRLLPLGAYIHELEEGNIYYLLPIPASGGTLDEDDLVQAIALAVVQVKVFGSVVAQLVSGQVSLDQALGALKRLVDRAGR